MTAAIFVGLGYLLGSIPFSPWLGRSFLGMDVRNVGDGNPGAVNAWKAGGWRLGIACLLLDYVKGVLPVGLAHFGAGIVGWALVPVALAPVVGHAFPLFLGFRGGKSVAVTFGVWTGLTLGEAPIILGMFCLLFVGLLTGEGWAVVLSMLGLLAHLLLHQAQGELLAIWGGNMLILVGKHEYDLRQPVRLRSRLLGFRRRSP